MNYSIDTKFSIGDNVKIQSGETGSIFSITVEITSARTVVFYTVRVNIGIGYTLAKKSEDELSVCE